jgi:hypothetical protein
MLRSRVSVVVVLALEDVVGGHLKARRRGYVAVVAAVGAQRRSGGGRSAHATAAADADAMRCGYGGHGVICDDERCFSVVCESGDGAFSVVGVVPSFTFFILACRHEGTEQGTATRDTGSSYFIHFKCKFL